MVVLDVNMLGLDGFGTAKRLKQQSWAFPRFLGPRSRRHVLITFHDLVCVS
jgi:hypothetical protein